MTSLRLAPLALLLSMLPLAPSFADEPGARWIEGSVVYGVVPPLFGEPGFQAVTERLDALAAQGFDVLWIAPVFDTDDKSHISYAVTDMRGIRSDFGTEDELKTLVREAKKRGLRVILDFVANHTSSGHPHFLDAERRGRASPHWKSYERDADGNARHEFNWTNLKNLDVRQPAVRRMVTDALLYWVREFDVDGFRLDAAWGPRDRSKEFWPAVVRELRAERPDLFLLAEASACEPDWIANGFDAAYDWTTQLGEWAWKDVFEDPTQAGHRLARALERCATTPKGQVARFLDNNDTGERFVTRHGVRTTRVATVLLHTLPGVPMLFTGQEIGAEYEPYVDIPPLEWTDRHGLKGLHKQLAGLREDLPALSRGSYEPVPTERASSIAFLRREGSSFALVAADFASGGPLELRVSPAWSQRLKRTPLEDALTGMAVPVRTTRAGAVVLDLPSSGVRVLVPTT